MLWPQVELICENTVRSHNRCVPFESQHTDQVQLNLRLMRKPV